MKRKDIYTTIWTTIHSYVTLYCRYRHCLCYYPRIYDSGASYHHGSSRDLLRRLAQHRIAWLTVASIMLAGLLLFCAYLIVRFGSFPCKNGSFKPNAQYVILVFFLRRILQGIWFKVTSTLQVLVTVSPMDNYFIVLHYR